jgi:hypothetical protein
VRAGPIAIALALLAAVSCSACGAADRADDATSVAHVFQAALGGKDGQKACAQLSEETTSKLEQDEGAPCEEAIFDVDLPTATGVPRARVYVTSASVEVDGGTLFLDEAPGGWEISAAGCKPSSPDMPFDCELED